jgi:hypothetical protein
MAYKGLADHMIHRVIGVLVVLVWWWMICHLHQSVPDLGAAASSGISRAGRGAFYVLCIPLLAAALLIFPDFFVNRFSPSSQMTNKPLLGTGFWRFFGYFALLVSWGVLQLFR